MTEDKAGGSGPSEQVDTNTVYEQWYHELRYYRLYEQAVAFWASTVLLAFAGGAVVYRTAKPAVLSVFLRLLLMLAPIVFAATAAFIVGYIARRYRQLRAQRTSMEPEWKRQLDAKTVKPLPVVFNPTVAQIVLILLLGVIAAVMIWAVTD